MEQEKGRIIRGSVDVDVLASYPAMRYAVADQFQVGMEGVNVFLLEKVDEDGVS